MRDHGTSEDAARRFVAEQELNVFRDDDRSQGVPDDQFFLEMEQKLARDMLDERRREVRGATARAEGVKRQASVLGQQRRDMAVLGAVFHQLTSKACPCDAFDANGRCEDTAVVVCVDCRPGDSGGQRLCSSHDVCAHARDACVCRGRFVVIRNGDGGVLRKLAINEFVVQKSPVEWEEDTLRVLEDAHISRLSLALPLTLPIDVRACPCGSVAFVAEECDRAGQVTV